MNIYKAINENHFKVGDILYFCNRLNSHLNGCGKILRISSDCFIISDVKSPTGHVVIHDSYRVFKKPFYVQTSLF